MTGPAHSASCVLNEPMNAYLSQTQQGMKPGMPGPRVPCRGVQGFLKSPGRRPQDLSSVPSLGTPKLPHNLGKGRAEEPASRRRKPHLGQPLQSLCKSQAWAPVKSPLRLFTPGSAPQGGPREVGGFSPAQASLEQARTGWVAQRLRAVPGAF